MVHPVAHVNLRHSQQHIPWLEFTLPNWSYRFLPLRLVVLLWLLLRAFSLLLVFFLVGVFRLFILLSPEHTVQDHLHFIILLCIINSLCIFYLENSMASHALFTLPWSSSIIELLLTAVVEASPLVHRQAQGVRYLKVEEELFSVLPPKLRLSLNYRVRDSLDG